MSRKFLFFLGTAIALALPAYAQPEAAPLQVRALLHDPLGAPANLFYTDPAGAAVPLAFKPRALTEPLLVLPAAGTIVLHDKAAIDPKNPMASAAASVKVPADLKRAILIVMAAPPGSNPAYRLMLLDDSEKTFPGGESRAISLINVETAIQAGEHKLPVLPGKIARVPAVRKVNDFNMAQTNFYYRQAGTWVPFAERQLQYIDDSRRLFIIHATPGALHPTVATIVDNQFKAGVAPAEAPAP